MTQHLDASALRALFDRQQMAFDAHRCPSADERRQNLQRLLDVVLSRQDEIAAAIASDFSARSSHETAGAEVFPLVSAIRYLRTHLKSWMRTEGRHVSLAFKPARARVHVQPLGVIGVISPWNYPVQLALTPVATALAAGNRVMLKPSELTPATSALMADMLDVFSDDLVAVCQGGVDTGVAFSSLPFDHLLYTGSTHVGRLVMQAAAKNLTPVTLELGGKSPALLHHSYPLDKAVESITFGKLYNAGQTCIAPDYALVPRAKVDAFVTAFREAASRFYPTLADNPDYTSIVNQHHRARLQGLLQDARDKGARVIEINPASEDLSGAGHKLAPHLVLDANDEMHILQDEIFGPLLPIVAYDTLDDAIRYVNARPRPLALYYFDHDSHRVDKVLNNTVSGGACVNSTLLHFATDDLPFGGVGPSGMGAYHGREGFNTFSHRKGVFHQARVNGAPLLLPPYGRTIEGLTKLLIGR